MPKIHNKELTPLARDLRKSLTKEERRLWYECLRTHSAKFVRQKVLGQYIADFYCAAAKLVVELDGSQHYEPAMQHNDQLRTEYLQQYGIEVVRFSNRDVNENFRAVCEHIDNIVKIRTGK